MERSIQLLVNVNSPLLPLLGFYAQSFFEWFLRDILYLFCFMVQIWCWQSFQLNRTVLRIHYYDLLETSLCKDFYVDFALYPCVVAFFFIKQHFVEVWEIHRSIHIPKRNEIPNCSENTLRRMIIKTENPLQEVFFVFMESPFLSVLCTGF